MFKKNCKNNKKEKKPQKLIIADVSACLHVLWPANLLYQPAVVAMLVSVSYLSFFSFHAYKV